MSLTTMTHKKGEEAAVEEAERTALQSTANHIPEE